MELTTSWQVIAESPLSLSGTKLQIKGKYSTQSTGNNTSTVQMEERIICGNASFHCYTHSSNFTGGTFDASDYQ